MRDPLSFRIKKKIDRYINDPIVAIMAVILLQLALHKTHFGGLKQLQHPANILTV